MQLIQFDSHSYVKHHKKDVLNLWEDILGNSSPSPKEDPDEVIRQRMFVELWHRLEEDVDIDTV